MPLNRDVKVIALVSAVVGFCSGMSGLLFTLYIDYLQISLPIMGVMFSVSGLVAFFVMIFIGVQCDVWRRKLVYSAALLLNSISTFFTSFLRDVWELTAVRITDNIGVQTRMTVHSTLIYEHVKVGYAKIIARIQGLEFTFSGVGFLAAGSLLLYLGFQGSFISLSLMLLGALLLFQLMKEPVRPKVKRKSIWETYRFDINKQLKILCVFNLLNQFGFAICHTFFVFILFFAKKFMLDPQTLSIVLALHNFTFGIPMFVASKLYAKKNVNYKRMFMIGNMLTGLPHILAAVIPSLIPAAAIWFLHDIIGASISAPAQQTLMQVYSRDEQRAKDVNMTSVFGSIGMIIGPVIGGFLAGIDISLPFLVGGAIVVASTIFIIPLKTTDAP
jgi:DHA1 family multidrug resistance protein-like MFS transporter